MCDQESIAHCMTTGVGSELCQSVSGVFFHRTNGLSMMMFAQRGNTALNMQPCCIDLRQSLGNSASAHAERGLACKTAVAG